MFSAHPDTRPRITFLSCLALLSALCLISGEVVAEGTAEKYPAHPVKLIVPFPPGGPTDIVARPFAEALSQSLGQPVVIENRGGAGGAIGAAAVAKASADGYTLLLGTVGVISINPALYPKLAYAPERDLESVALLAAAPVALAAHPSLPANTLAELKALAASQSLRFGSAGNGTPGHLTGEMFRSASGISLAHVPYKGSAPAVQDLLGGHLELVFDPLQSVLPHIRAGKLKALGISSAQPAPQLPGVPTFIEAGVKTETTAWWGVFAPAATPDAILDALARHLARARENATVRQLESLGIVLLPEQTRAAQQDFLRAEAVKWGKAVRDSGAGID
ncbi:MAG: tripartite tricarboxylate transporter substrate binding protein [Zoogloeaceae bacterium]|jgi:tripartite-type tricarboxylate transporter receptor subunit TctC|nr:tripartite tricarboxylate transporter substrate binding protein [Zoogloeaceae bacterium]